MGTTNLFRGKVIAIESGVVKVQTETAGIFHVKPQDGRPMPTEGMTVGVVVRPEKIRIRVTEAAATATLNVLRGVILDRTYFGATTQVRLKTAEDQPPLIALLANQTSAKMPTLKIGDRYYAVWEASDSVLVYDV